MTFTQALSDVEDAISTGPRGRAVSPDAIVHAASILVLADEVRHVGIYDLEQSQAAQSAADALHNLVDSVRDAVSCIPARYRVESTPTP
jgi:hypothetical protein